MSLQSASEFATPLKFSLMRRMLTPPTADRKSDEQTATSIKVRRLTSKRNTFGSSWAGDQHYSSSLVEAAANWALKTQFAHSGPWPSPGRVMRSDRQRALVQRFLIADIYVQEFGKQVGESIVLERQFFDFMTKAASSTKTISTLSEQCWLQCPLARDAGQCLDCGVMVPFSWALLEWRARPKNTNGLCLRAVDARKAKRAEDKEASVIKRLQKRTEANAHRSAEKSQIQQENKDGKKAKRQQN
jgi:hypothetical protein